MPEGGEKPWSEDFDGAELGQAEIQIDHLFQELTTKATGE
jgi:hypothetical protein